MIMDDEEGSTSSTDESLSIIDDDSEDAGATLSISESLNLSYKRPKILYPWRDSFLDSFHWLRYDIATKTAHCSFKKCEMYYPQSCFESSNWRIRTWQTTFQTRLFAQHEKTKTHKRQKSLPPLAKGQASLLLTPVADVYPDDAVWIRIQGAWWLAKEEVAITKFSSYVECLLHTHGYKPTAYCDNRAAWDILSLLAKWFRTRLKLRLADSPYYSIMVDETTDKSMTSQLIIRQVPEV